MHRLEGICVYTWRVNHGKYLQRLRTMHSIKMKLSDPRALTPITIGVCRSLEDYSKHFFQRSSRFKAKLRESYRDFPYTACSQTCIAAPLINIILKNCIVTKDESILTYRNHPPKVHSLLNVSLLMYILEIWIKA